MIARSAAPALLSDSATRAAVRIVSAQLANAECAAVRLEDPEDRDALHDFRVALRRLRSALRAYRPQLGRAASRKTRSQLRDLGRATNRGRDAEVQAAWIRAAGAELPPVARKGTGRLLQKLRRKRSSKLVNFKDELAEIADRMRKRLDPTGGDLSGFAGVYTTLLLDHVRDAAACLAAIEGPEQVEEAHEARIAVKRLRYLLEPIGTEVPPAETMAHDLAALQDVLGELHDSHVLEEELVAARTQREAPARAITALETRNRQRRDRCFAALEESWLGEKSAAFFDSVRALLLAAGR